jgi:hypothetical protein
MIRVVHPGSGSRILIFYPSRIPDPVSKEAPDAGSKTLTGSRTDLGCEPDDPDLPFLADPVAPVLSLQYNKNLKWTVQRLTQENRHVKAVFLKWIKSHNKISELGFLLSKL